MILNYHFASVRLTRMTSHFGHIDIQNLSTEGISILSAYQYSLTPRQNLGPWSLIPRVGTLPTSTPNLGVILFLFISRGTTPLCPRVSIRIPGKALIPAALSTSLMPAPAPAPTTPSPNPSRPFPVSRLSQQTKLVLPASISTQMVWLVLMREVLIGCRATGGKTASLVAAVQTVMEQVRTCLHGIVKILLTEG